MNTPMIEFHLLCENDVYDNNVPIYWKLYENGILKQVKLTNLWRYEINHLLIKFNLLPNFWKIVQCAYLKNLNPFLKNDFQNFDINFKQR
jgi:hypothetical protein